MLTIENLEVKIGTKVALAGLNLTVQPGTVHAIMGPNGSGKSTLAAVLAGKPGYEVTSGSITFQGQDLLALSPEDRAAIGIFLAFQYPIEIPGVSNTTFLQTAINQIRKKRNLEPLDAVNFLRLLKEKAALVHIDASLLHRALNEGFSGGEKKKNEILQMALLDPTLAILDEIDSGLDIDALKNVAAGINQLRKPTHAILLITHYQRLLDLVIPDVVHVLYKGKIVQSGAAALVKELEAKGYDWLSENTL